MSDPVRNPNSSAVTLKDVAERCGVAKITVSYAFRPDNPHVSAATRERILAVAHEMGYNPAQQHAARRLRLQRSGQQLINHVVALFLPTSQYDAPHFLPLFRGIQRTLLAERFALLACYADGYPGNPEELPLVFERGDVDGAIVYCTMYQQVQQLQQMPLFNGRPLVSLLDALPGCANVEVDNQAGAFALTRHLLELGHRHLLHSFPEKAFHIADVRLAGMRAAYREQGLDPESHLHFVYTAGCSSAAEQEAVLDLLRARPQITAVVAQHDFAATHLYQAMQRTGLRVPDDISLVGFEDILSIPGSDGANILTTIHAPLELVGEQAARMMIRQITGRANAGEVVTLPVNLVVRSSTAPPRR